MPGQSSSLLPDELTPPPAVRPNSPRVRSQNAPRIRPGRHSVNIAVSADDADVYVNGQEIIHGEPTQQVMPQSLPAPAQSGSFIPVIPGTIVPPTPRPPTPAQRQQMDLQNDLLAFPEDIV